VILRGENATIRRSGAADETVALGEVVATLTT
jgi:hypothetical protein